MNRDLPVTTVRVTLYTGQKASLELNLTNTVGDIFKFVNSLCSVRTRYKLVSGYPPRPLED